MARNCWVAETALSVGQAETDRTRLRIALRNVRSSAIAQVRRQHHRQRSRIAAAATTQLLEAAGKKQAVAANRPSSPITRIELMKRILVQALPVILERVGVETLSVQITVRLPVQPVGAAPADRVGDEPSRVSVLGGVIARGDTIFLNRLRRRRRKCPGIQKIVILDAIKQITRRRRALPVRRNLQAPAGDRRHHHIGQRDGHRENIAGRQWHLSNLPRRDDIRKRRLS